MTIFFPQIYIYIYIYMRYIYVYILHIYIYDNNKNIHMFMKKTFSNCQATYEKELYLQFKKSDNFFHRV